jgi:hypothetical protein
MLTGKDITKLVKEFEKTFATKKEFADFKQEMSGNFSDFKQNMGVEFLALENRLDNKIENLGQNILIYKDEISVGMDKQMEILQRLDQERIFTNETIKRMQKEMEAHEQQLQKIKKHLKIA